MADMDEDWVEKAPKKKGLPRWVWFTCGCGSLLALLGAAGLMFMSWKIFDKGTDPEIQWPLIDEAVGFEERPDLELEVGMQIPFSGLQQFKLWDREADTLAMLFASERGDVLAEYMAEKPSSSVIMGFGTPIGAELGSLELRGRQVPFLRFDSIKGQDIDKGYESGIRVDLGRVKEKYVVLELRKQGETSDDDVRAFLAPFELWDE